jgi:hypothetical protein
MGLQIPNFDDPNMGADDDDGDDDFEAELKLMQQDAGSPVSKRPKTKPKKPGSFFSVRIFNRKRNFFYMF